MVNGTVITSRRLYMLPVAVWMLTMAAGYFPTQWLAGWGGIHAMIIAQVVVIGIVYVTLIPAMQQMVNAEKPRQFKIALTTGVVRFFLTLLIITVIVWNGSLNTMVFLIWAAIAYLVMIKVETIILIKWSTLIERQHQ